MLAVTTGNYDSNFFSVWIWCGEHVPIREINNMQIIKFESNKY